MKPHRAVFGVLSALTLAPMAAHAGAANTGFFSCTRDPEGSGYCHGTYLGARNNPNATDGVTFAMDTDGLAFFRAVYNNTFYGCLQYVSAGTMAHATWTAALTARSYFYVTWDAEGTCTWVYLANQSFEQSLPQ